MAGGCCEREELERLALAWRVWEKDEDGWFVCCIGILFVGLDRGSGRGIFGLIYLLARMILSWPLIGLSRKSLILNGSI